MRQLLLLLTLIATLHVAAQQDTVYPAGCYMSIEELQTKAPTKPCKLQIGINKGGNFLGFESNDYTLTSSNDCLSKKEIRSDMFAYCDGKNLYLNGNKHDLQGAYVGITLRGSNFMAFRGARTSGEAFATLLMGSGSVENSEAGKRYLYIMDMKTGKSGYASAEYVLAALAPWPELQKQYQAEANKESEETILKYINLCNQTK